MLTNHIGKQASSTTKFNLQNVDASWHAIITQALQAMDADYLQKILGDETWLPGHAQIFNAFSLPLSAVNYVLFGESPYPRVQSANGYAFWDAAVTHLWSPTGLSKPVNRATSLRNFIKMLLIAAGELTPDHTTQADIANLDKSHLIQTNNELFGNLLNKGFLLLNATPVLSPAGVRKDARAWRPFLKQILHFLIEQKPAVEFILLGGIANEIDSLITHTGLKKLYAEHPYNISFINNPEMLNFFRPFNLLTA